MTLQSSSYLLPKFSRVPLTIVLIRGISTMVNGTLLNFGKRYEDIFDQWPKLLLGLDALSNKKILKGVYYIGTYLVIFLVSRQSELRHSMMHSSEPHSVYKTILNCSIKWQRLYKYNMHIFRRLQMQIFCHIHTSQTFKLHKNVSGFCIKNSHL